MKSTITEIEEAAAPAVETAASIRIEASKTAPAILGPNSQSGTGGEDAVLLPACCHYCGTVEDSAAPFVDRIGHHIFCDDACKWDFAEQNKMIGTTAPTEAPRFQIDSMSRFEWWSGKLADVAARRKRIAANYARQIQQLDQDEARALRLQPQAQAFVKHELERTKAKRSSVTTLHGTGTITKYAETVVLMPGASADPAILAHARAIGCIVVVPEVPAVPATEAVDTAAYLKAAKDRDKESPLPPGCDTQPAREVFRFTLAPDDEETAPKPAKASKKK